MNGYNPKIMVSFIFLLEKITEDRGLVLFQLQGNGEKWKRISIDRLMVLIIKIDQFSQFGLSINGSNVVIRSNWLAGSIEGIRFNPYSPLILQKKKISVAPVAVALRITLKNDWNDFHYSLWVYGPKIVTK